MSAASLTSTQFPYLPLTLHVQGYITTVVALLDTGFDGNVALPPDLLPANIAPDLDLGWVLADGTMVHAPAYVGTVRLGNFGPFNVTITALGDEPIIDRFAITLDHGQRAIVAP